MSNSPWLPVITDREWKVWGTFPPGGQDYNLQSLSELGTFAKVTLSGFWVGVGVGHPQAPLQKTPASAGTRHSCYLPPSRTVESLHLKTMPGEGVSAWGLGSHFLWRPTELGPKALPRLCSRPADEGE